MAHRYADPKAFDRLRSTYRQEAYNKHGEMYLGTIENIDLLDESMRAKPLRLAEVAR